MKKILIIASLLAVAFLVLSISLLAANFTDVPKDAYYAEAAERMADKGILSGFGDGRYYGNLELTRAQFAALACKLLGKVDEATMLKGKTSFDDVPETHWSTGYVNYAAANKIINGDGDGKFRPDDYVKYEEAIKVIICVIDPDNNITIDPSDWSKNFIAEAQKLGLTKNLVGKKGEFMKRSDIAVIADKAFSVINNENDGTTTKKGNTGTPVTNTAATTEKKDPVATTDTTTKKPTAVTTLKTQNWDNMLPVSPEE